MKAVFLDGVNQPFVVRETPIPEPGQGEYRIRIKAAALNHRDLWIQKGQYAGLRFPSIQGSDGSGIIEAAGEGTDQSRIGEEIIINSSLNWGNNPNTQVKDYIILGMAKDGTFADYSVVADRLVFPKPSHLTHEQAAALPLAGLTAYRALFSRARVQPGDNVLVTGAGGGVALFCIQYAIALGCTTWVTSGSEHKIAQAIALGAKGGASYKSENWHKTLQTQSGGFDVIIDSSGGDTFSKLVDICRPAGRIAMYGATLGAFDSGVPAKIFWKQLTICGSTMGNDNEFKAMLDFVNQHQLVPVVDTVYAIDDFQQAADRMSAGQQFGKVVIQL